MESCGDMAFDPTLWILIAQREIDGHKVVLYRDRSQDWVEHLVCDCDEFQQVRLREWRRYCSHTNRWNDS